MAIASFATSVNLNFSRRATLSFAAEKFKTRAPAAVSSSTKRRLTVSTCLAENGRFEKKQSDSEEEIKRVRFKDYTERSKNLMKSDGGPPRWFSPLECGPPHLDNSPLFLYLPGIDGIGLGLILHHQRLGKIFDIWCLHIPVMDRTPFKDMVQLVEMTVKSECSLSPDRPIYLVGESIGGCLALAVAARNPDIDLMLILANPATSFNMSRLQTLLYLLEIVPEQLHVGAPNVLSLLTGDPLRMASLEKGVSLQQTVEELSEGFSALLPSSVLADVLPRESILWKLWMLRSASSFVNFRLRSVKSEVLIFASGRDLLLPSQDEAKRLHDILPNCRVRYFNDSGHTLLLEEGIDFVTIIKGVGFYRRTKNMDYVSDFMPPTSSELKQTSESYRWFDLVASPVMLSTLEDGNIVRGLTGIPCKGPVVFVSYHMLLGLDLSSLVYHFWAEKNILLRGLAHPMLFGKTFDCQSEDPSSNDNIRLLGGVPISATNFYKLLSTNSHILLFPGGVREALHRKGEEYQLFWPSQSEFVRMAARFGAKIVPYGAVGEDDIFNVILDYNDQMKIPYFKNIIETINDGRFERLRTELNEEVAQQDLYSPQYVPKLPGRLYYLFGKPIETDGRYEELRDKKRASEVYLQVKSEVERHIAYLKEKRETDPYRSLLPRLLYKATHGFTSQVPTFEI